MGPIAAGHMIPPGEVEAQHGLLSGFRSEWLRDPKGGICSGLPSEPRLHACPEHSGWMPRHTLRISVTLCARFAFSLAHPHGFGGERGRRGTTGHYIEYTGKQQSIIHFSTAELQTWDLYKVGKLKYTLHKINVLPKRCLTHRPITYMR